MYIQNNDERSWIQNKLESKSDQIQYSEEEKKKILVKAYGENSSEVTDCFIELGNLYKDIAEYDKAMKCYEMI